MNSIQLLQIRKVLPKGYRQILSKRTGYSTTYIDHVLSGRRFNQSIVDSAVSLLEEHIATQEEKSKRIHDVLVKSNV